MPAVGFVECLTAQGQLNGLTASRGPCSGYAASNCLPHGRRNTNVHAFDAHHIRVPWHSFSHQPQLLAWTSPLCWMNVCPLYDSFNFHEAGKSAFNWASALLLRPQHSTDLQPEILRQQILGVFGRGQPGPIFVDVKYIEKYVKVEIQKKKWWWFHRHNKPPKLDLPPAGMQSLVTTRMLFSKNRPDCVEPWGGFNFQGLREVLLPSLRENMGTTAKVPWEFVPQIFPHMLCTFI